MSQIALTPNASGTGTFTLAAPGTNTNRTATLPDATTELVGTDATQTLTNKTIQNSPIQGGAITSGTAVASTSGTSIDFTSIPSWVKRITVMFSGVSTASTGIPIIQLGDAGGVENTGYVSRCTRLTAAAAVTSLTATDGFLYTQFGGAAEAITGAVVLSKLDGNSWVCTGLNQTALYLNTLAGSKTLSDTLTQVRITTQGGTDTFDAGSINILYEG